MNAKKSLVVYLTAGYPSRKIFIQAAQVAADEGTDLLEVGLPFSDPVADGPVIQETSQAAIRMGVNYRRVLDLAADLPSALPKVMMTYSNPLFVRTWPKAFGEIHQAGFSGCVIPDVPAEELAGLIPFCPRGTSSHPFYLVPFAAPTTRGERLKTVAAAAQNGAFIYLVSLRGITGSKISARSGREIASLTASLRRLTHAPLFVGFGVRTAADAMAFARYADGVIVGTAALQALRRGIRPFAQLLRKLRAGLN